jgi:ribose 5-phosphate isomerase RpiB
MYTMCMGDRTVRPAVSWDLVQTFLAAEFSQDERHLGRLVTVASLEAGSQSGHAQGDTRGRRQDGTIGD